PRGAERWRSGGSERVEAGVERGWIGGDDRDVAELSARARALAVEVQVRAGHGEDALGVGQRADDVDHRALSAGRGRAERRAGERAQVVLELARLRALDRPVPAVVHAGRDLVGEQIDAVVEELEREHADVVELLEDGAGVRLGALLMTLVELRRRRARE